MTTRAERDWWDHSHGIRILEVGGIGPNPFAGMLLADMGADVIRLDREAGAGLGASPARDPSLRDRQTLAVDLKSAPGSDARARARGACRRADRGLPPRGDGAPRARARRLLARNPQLVYGRMTGYGQDGPMARVAGHDINYISLSGVLGASQRVGEKPMFAINTVGDYGGGAVLLAFGVVCALLEARNVRAGADRRRGDGRRLGAAADDGPRAARGGQLEREPGTNVLDSGAHFYEVYVTADGGHVAVGAIEPQFYARLLELLELPAEQLPQWDRERWPEFKERFSTAVRARTAAEWAALLESEEVCVTVVRGPFDAHLHPQWPRGARSSSSTACASRGRRRASAGRRRPRGQPSRIQRRRSTAGASSGSCSR